MERCPCCMARLSGAVVCPRCQADLGGVIGSEQTAQYWLDLSVRFWMQREPVLAIQTLTKSLRLKKLPPALAFCDFVVHSQVHQVLALLAKNNFTEAKYRLSLLRDLQPDNNLLKQLQGFTGYLMAKRDGYLHKLLSQ